MKIIVIPNEAGRQGAGRPPLRIRHRRVDGPDHGRDVLPVPRVYLAARARPRADAFVLEVRRESSQLTERTTDHGKD